MLLQARQQEHTIEAREAELQQWLLDLLRRHGPGRYIVDIAADGRIEVKRLRMPLHFMCPVRLEGGRNEES